MEQSSPIDHALRQFEATEANLEKLERVFKEIRNLIPDGIEFGSNVNYDEQCRIFNDILEVLPKIDGWKPQCTFWDLNEIAQGRFDAFEISEPTASFGLEESIDEPVRQLSEYRYKLNKKRSQLIKKALSNCTANIDESLRILLKKYDESIDPKTPIDNEILSKIINIISEIEVLLGSNVKRPDRWPDLKRHLHFGLKHDLDDIINLDWPNVNSWLSKVPYDRNEPIPVEIEDLGELAKTEPQGTIVTSLKWEILTPEDFERLIFVLISDATGYENPEWLMQTNAPDKGRDLSVMRVIPDSLSNTQRQRVIIQCKHWLKKSISANEIAVLMQQMTLWEPPKVDVLIIATSGRFSADVVSLIEKNNASDKALRIEMWPESHLELLLAKRPSLIAEFKLK